MRHDQIDARDALADDQRLEEYLRLTVVHRDDMILPGGMKKNVRLVVEEVERLRARIAAIPENMNVRSMQQVE